MVGVERTDMLKTVGVSPGVRGLEPGEDGTTRCPWYGQRGTAKFAADELEGGRGTARDRRREKILHGTGERKYCAGQAGENTARGRREKILRGADERNTARDRREKILRGTDERNAARGRREKYCAGQARENTARDSREKILRRTESIPNFRSPFYIQW